MNFSIQVRSLKDDKLKSGYSTEIFLDKLPGNRFYNDFADLVDKRAQIIFPGETSDHTIKGDRIFGILKSDKVSSATVQ